MDIKMDPMTAGLLIGVVTDAIVTVAAKQNNISKEEMWAKINALQPKADNLEKWLRGVIG